MKVLGSRNCILMYKDDFKTESIKLMYDDDIPSLFVHVSLHEIILVLSETVNIGVVAGGLCYHRTKI